VALREKKDVQHVVVRTGRKKHKHEPPHGGWKVAYADFVTAMMAFFLLMWLVNSTDADQKKAMSEYFNPYQAEDDSSQVEVSAGIISIMDGGQMGGDQIHDREIRDSQGNPESESQSEDIVGEETFASPLSYWEVVEIPRDEYDRLKEQAEAVSSAGAGQAGPGPLDPGLRKLAEELEDLKRNVPLLREFSEQIMVEETEEGLRVQFVDQEDFEMFASGSAQLNRDAASMIRVFGSILKDVPHKIAISGHTDAASFPGQGYSNWELSADRANAARRAILEAGVRTEMIHGVEGKAAQAPLIAENPLDPRNRRIAFMILR
jgi:chemotaxis protein MotB